MGRLAIVGGHSVLGFDLSGVLGPGPRLRRLPVPGGPVTLVEAGPVVLLQRHGHDRYVPAHRLDHHAHARALVEMGCDRVLALGSVGALRATFPVGTVLVPDDFVALAAQPDTRFADERGHRVPGFDGPWRARVVAAWRAHAPQPPVDGGVYWQVMGPRFETGAEVRFLAAFADVVGMTIGSECVACAERGLAYAAVCVVDNLANGVSGTALTVEEFEAGKAANRHALVQTVQRVVAVLV